MTSTRHGSSPFTATQWQELEHQALIFKYMLYGIPVPPDLLYSIKRGWDLPITPNLPRFFPQHPSGWGCFQVGFGRKGADPEPGRCRRTDGKKWRCSKEAFPDSKYCERHMHRGRNRSRKPVESTPTTPPSASSTNPSSSSPSAAAPPAEHPFLQRHSPKTVGIPMGIPNLDSLTHSSSAVKDYRYLHGLKENMVDEHAFFSESSGSLKSIADSGLDMSWRSMKRASSVLSGSYYSQLQQQQKLTETGSREPQQQPPLRLFFDEWAPPKNRASWLDLEADPSDRTQLSISIPTADSHLPNSR